MVRVYLTGDLCLTAPAGAIRAERLPGRQGRIAFALLADQHANPVSRDELAAAIWTDSLPAAHEVALSAIVSKLRALLDEVGVGRAALIAEAGCYQLVLPARVWVDLEVATESIHLAEAALQAGDHAGAYGPAVVACAILRRPFLRGLEGQWIDSRRDSLHTAQLRALDCLAQIHAWNGEESLALRAAREAVSLEPYRESGYRQLMLLHDSAGNRAEALRVYEELTSLLAAELRTAPSAETRGLVETIASRP
jgi:DNA-binding SARP family transcriptional activator